MAEQLIIIGGGPAGLAAAIYAARASLNPLVVEGVSAGGQLTLTSEVENYPGFPKGILGPELVRQFRDQAVRFGTRLVQENVVGIEPRENRTHKTDRTYRIKTDKQIFQARAVLIATGADAIWIGLDSEKRLMGKGVSACATCDGFFFRNKVIAVVGGGDTAMEEALTLTKFAEKVYVIHRRDTFRASKIMQKRVLKHPKIEVVWNAAVTEVLGTERVEGVRLSTGDVLKLEGLFVAIGHKPATEFLGKSTIALDKKGYIWTSARVATEVQLHGSKIDVCASDFNFTFASATSVSGIFAAGDCVDHLYRQAATAVGMGVASELEVEKYLED